MHKVGTCIDSSDNSDKVKVRRLMIHQMNGRIFTDCTTSTDTLNILVYLCRVTINIWKRLRVGGHDKDRKEYYMYGIGRKGTNHERRESTENERVQER